MVVVGVCAKCKEPIDNEESGYIIDDKGRIYHAAGVEYKQETLSVEFSQKKKIIKAAITAKPLGKNCYTRVM